jgi:hypothetical protein
MRANAIIQVRAPVVRCTVRSATAKLVSWSTASRNHTLAKLSDNEEHRKPVQGDTRSVEASAFHRRPDDESSRDFLLCGHIHCSKSSLDVAHAFGSKKTCSAAILFRLPLIWVGYAGIFAAVKSASV